MLEKSLRIGIDWLSLYGFEISHDERDISKETTSIYYQERLRIEEPLFTIDSSVRIYEDGRMTKYKSLRFNPNRILWGNNINNSRKEDLELAIEKLKEMLRAKGITINLSNAKIKDIEVNINFNKKFEELKEALEVMFINSPSLKKISNFEGGHSYRNMFSDGTIQANWNAYKGIAYDKTREVEDFDLLSEPLTRLEWQFKSYIYNYHLSKIDKDTSLVCLIDNFDEIIDYIFKEQTKRRLVVPAQNYIEKQIKSNLERGYKRFKESGKLGKRLNKKVERNVYKYLEEQYWIFDHIFLEELVEKYDKTHKTREIERIRKRYIHHNNLENFNYLVDIIFNH